jgi:hypothetical protein
MNTEIKPMTEKDLQNLLKEHETLNPGLTIREDTKEALIKYATIGLPLGGFLTAVVENDLCGALGKADSYNRATIFQIVEFLYNDMPSVCWGSPEKVKAWYKTFQK